MTNHPNQHRKTPLWRSMLFVPAHLQRFVDKAHTRGADALILDLEDSVPLAEKTAAREGVAAAAAKASSGGAEVLVRINANLRLAIRDLEAVVAPGIRALVVPKVSSAEQLQAISEVVAELEAEAGMQHLSTGLVAQIESPVALANVWRIAEADSRLLGLSLGTEDFSSAAGMQPNADSLLFPSQQIVFAARVAGILPLGFVASIADFSDLQAFGETIQRARALGFVGGFCIHPSQVDIMNAGFAPSSQEAAEARELVETYHRAHDQGRGAVEYKGKMVDFPVFERAQALLRTAQNVAERNRRKNDL